MKEVFSLKTQNWHDSKSWYTEQMPMGSTKSLNLDTILFTIWAKLENFPFIVFIEFSKHRHRQACTLHTTKNHSKYIQMLHENETHWLHFAVHSNWIVWLFLLVLRRIFRCGLKIHRKDNVSTHTHTHINALLLISLNQYLILIDLIWNRELKIGIVVNWNRRNKSNVICGKYRGIINRSAAEIH